MTENDTIHILGVPGSLRSGSYNCALLRAARELAPPGIVIHLYDLSQVPLYNSDVETQGDPAAVSEWKQAIRQAHALLIATPEYNYGVPGVLKNAIDWASRPPGKSPLNGKIAAIMGASMGMGGAVRAQLALRQSFLFTETHVMTKSELLLARAQDKFDAEGRLTDESTRTFLSKFLVSFLEWIRWVNRAKSPG